jgi:ketosteroid isomerase-like protein
MQPQTEIKSFEERLTLAERNSDRAALDALLHPDFQGVSMKGRKLDRSGFIDMLCNPRLSFTILEIENLEIHPAGNTYVAIGRSVFVAQANGARFEGSAHFMDVWIQSGSGWQLVASSVTPEAKT